MSKPMVALLVAFIAAALVVAWKFGALGVDQFVTLGSLIVGWSLWTALVAFVYAGIEKLFPNMLCVPPTDDVAAPRAEGA